MPLAYLGRYELRRHGQRVKLEMKPMELLIFLVSRRDGARATWRRGGCTYLWKVVASSQVQKQTLATPRREGTSPCAGSSRTAGTLRRFPGSFEKRLLRNRNRENVVGGRNLAEEVLPTNFLENEAGLVGARLLPFGREHKSAGGVIQVAENKLVQV